jgi:hypothetical protein
MKRLLASPRRRRRLAWAGSLLAAGGATVAVAALYPNTAPKPSGLRPGKPKITREEPPATPLPKRDLAAAQRTLDKFVLSAVLRRHVEVSYDLATPLVRGGLTRRQWGTGDIPVPPFPAKAVALARSKLVYSRRNVARFEVLLFTTPKSQLLPLLYSIELTRRTRRAPWLVDYAMPLGGGISTRPSPYRPAPAPALPDESGHGRLPLAWVFVPLSILSLIVLVPVGLAMRGWIGDRRADREYRTATSDGRPS